MSDTPPHHRASWHSPYSTKPRKACGTDSCEARDPCLRDISTARGQLRPLGLTGCPPRAGGKVWGLKPCCQTHFGLTCRGGEGTFLTALDPSEGHRTSRGRSQASEQLVPGVRCPQLAYRDLPPLTAGLTARPTRRQAIRGRNLDPRVSCWRVQTPRRQWLGRDLNKGCSLDKQQAGGFTAGLRSHPT